MPDINFNDAQQAYAFLTPQLYRINTAIEMIRYPSYDYASLVPVNTDGDMWDIGSVYYSGDVAGKAEYLSGKGFDMPYADIASTQYLQQNNFAGIGYEWSLQELERASKMGRALGSDKAGAARKIAESFIYGVAIAGSVAEKGTTGLVNDANVPAANVAADGTGATTSWANKTPLQILRDINEALNAPTIATKETSLANRLLLPTSAMQYLAGLPLGDNADKTVLSFIRENNFYTLTTNQPLEIRASRALETAGAGGTKRMVAYEYDRTVVQFHVPGPHEFLEPFRKSSMTWEVAGIMNIGAVEWRLPKGGVYRDGV